MAPSMLAAGPPGLRVLLDAGAVPALPGALELLVVEVVEVVEFATVG